MSTNDMAVDFDALSAAIAAICARHGVRRLVAFGSIARGEGRAGSDLDFLVEFETGRNVGFLALGRLARDLSAACGRRVDLVPIGGLKPALAKAIAADSRVVYAA